MALLRCGLVHKSCHMRFAMLCIWSIMVQHELYLIMASFSICSMRNILLTIAVLFSSVACPAYADIYCGNGFISADDPLNSYAVKKVIKLCGKPTKTQRWKTTKFIKTYYGFDKLSTKYTRLTYNRGSNTFIEYLTFRNNVLIAIKDGDYGSP